MQDLHEVVYAARPLGRLLRREVRKVTLHRLNLNKCNDGLEHPGARNRPRLEKELRESYVSLANSMKVCSLPEVTDYEVKGVRREEPFKLQVEGPAVAANQSATSVAGAARRLE